MGKIKADYLIVGQGLAGSWLAYEMLKRNLSVVIFDEGTPHTSSKKAAGIYNPITGRKMVKTWRADALFPDLENQYQKLEISLKSKFLYPIPIYRPFKTIEDQNDWDGRRTDSGYDQYLKKVLTEPIGYSNIHDPLGGIILNHSGYVNIPEFLKAMKLYIQNKGTYRREVFDYQRMELNFEGVSYDDINVGKVIFCEGVSSNPYWELPFRPVRGEIIDIETKLSSEHIINQGVFMIPKGQNRFTIGSTYDHKKLTYEPQAEGIKSLEERLKKLYSGKFEIVDKRAGVRPATHDRKPYIGLHHKYKTLGIFNGFGTKGVSLTPHFAKHFVDVLEGHSDIDEEVHVQRVV
ncbi:Glycine/D-amino acid oxidase [Ekhidna lutea]|uniref:Glycine/D-amino acid oxidase n=1 Tax=Ekhidna lutea TaxID=447679 RepID=A0A239IS30_EKHLU|nr:FAD-dependent oxidoreductase [Ekhidna lutea]SNS96008.1 Glycine/D-amino acid oxidase [Ekhidna lutea]